MGRDDDDHAEMDPDALMRRGDKKMTVSFTRWKPDLDEAVRCYEEAGARPVVRSDIDPRPDASLAPPAVVVADRRPRRPPLPPSLPPDARRAQA